MRIAVFQTLPVKGDKSANLRKMNEVAKGASELGTELLVFPELYLTRYNIGTLCHELAEDLEGPSIREARRIASTTRCALAFGFPERAGEKVHNSLAVIDRNGTLVGVYRKIQLFGDTEPSLFERGHEFSVLSLNGVKIGLGICYDIEFPEFGRRLAREKVDIAIIPTANMAPHWDVPTTLVRARALENAMAVVYANQCGTDEDTHYTGLSCIVGSNGQDLARAGVASETFIVSDIDVATHVVGATAPKQLEEITPALQRVETPVT